MSEFSAPMQFIDLAAQQKLIRPELESAILSVLNHGQYIMGPEVEELENELKKFTGAKYALSCANGTDALSLVLMAWGVGSGDAVFVPSFTYVATAEAPAQLGATPFFVDVCEDTFNMDPESFKQAVIDSRRLGLKPAVVIPVDLFGQPADVDAITAIAHVENIKVLVDGAQSFGGSSSGRRVGSMGDATTASFFPAKPLGCYGDGGVIFTSSEEDAGKIDSIRLHGKGKEKYDNIRIGLNSRLDTLQAAILLEKLKIFSGELFLRDEVASQYSRTLNKAFRRPIIAPNRVSAWAQYTLILEDRDQVQSSLRSAGIPSVVYYPNPLSRQTGYNQYPSVSSGTPVSELLSESVLSLPMHPYLLKTDQARIVEALNMNSGF
jgi:dTDP-4-amino-4,6-dideoxygalactose transaminase